jgi:hypothetical protein
MRSIYDMFHSTTAPVVAQSFFRFSAREMLRGPHVKLRFDRLKPGMRSRDVPEEQFLKSAFELILLRNPKAAAKRQRPSQV